MHDTILVGCRVIAVDIRHNNKEHVAVADRIINPSAAAFFFHQSEPFSNQVAEGKKTVSRSNNGAPTLTQAPLLLLFLFLLLLLLSFLSWKYLFIVGSLSAAADCERVFIWYTFVINGRSNIP